MILIRATTAAILHCVVVAQVQGPPIEPATETMAALRGEPAGQRIAALHRLARGAATGPILEAVALTLGDTEPEVRRTAVETLLALRPDLGDLRAQLLGLVRERKASGQQVRAQAQLAFRLGGLQPVANGAPDLEGLDDADADVRRKTVKAACALGEAAAPFENRLLAMLKDPNGDVRATVAGNIGTVGWTDTIREAVIGAIKDTAAVVRNAAAETLGRHADDDPEVVAALRTAVQDPDLDVRAQVLRSLGHGGKAGAAAAADIVASLRDREAKVRAAALEAVAEQRISSERAVADAVRCLDDDDRKVVLAALRTVAPMRQAAIAALPRLMALTGHALQDERRLALTAIWSVADAPRRGAVLLRSVEALNDDYAKVASTAHELLGKFIDDVCAGKR
ncbi:MAG: HEAT repeat domain-containing protein [Planctomycetes bacterium]|nr:HEAT repeat domain-containing protein [Planctomycetota bacterium]